MVGCKQLRKFLVCVKDNLFIKTLVGNKGDAQLDLIFTDKVLLTETNVLLTADTSSEEEVRKIERGFSWCCMLGGPEVKGRS